MKKIVRVLQSLLSHPMAKLRPFQVLYNFIRLQLIFRFKKKAIVFNWLNKTKLSVAQGEASVTGNFYFGLHEFSEMLFLLHLLKEDDLFIDVGANSGVYSILAASLGAKVISFEPVGNTYERLLRNIKLNQFENKITALNLGVANREAKLRFTLDKDCESHIEGFVNDDAQCDGAVTTTTLDKVCADKDPSLIKIDVEGFESLVVEGMQQCLANPTLLAVIIELGGVGERYGFDEAKIYETMRQFAMFPFRYNPLQRDLIKLENKPKANIIFIRDPELVIQRLKFSKSFSVLGVEI